MNFNFSDDAQWVLSASVMVARARGRSTATPEHIFLALKLQGDGGLGGHLLRRASHAPGSSDWAEDLDINAIEIRTVAPEELTQGSWAVLQGAMEVAGEQATPYVASEHLLLSLVSGSHGEGVADALAEAGVTESKVLRTWLAILMRDRLGPLATP